MDASPAKRRKTDHGAPGHAAAALPLDGAAASAGLFRPSTFLLETAELLDQSRVDYGALLPGGEALLRDIKTAIEGVETHEPVLIAQAAADFEKASGIAIPFPHPRPAADALLKLAMAPPAHCNVVGSFVLHTMTRSQREHAVDLIVEMPRALFQDKDYLDLRYFYKRAYYLAHVAKAVSGAAALAGVDVSFAYLGDNPLQPILVASPPPPPPAAVAAAAKHACTVRIIPCCPDGLFPRAKLLPGKACLRLDSGGGEEKDRVPTPFYNATLQAEAAYLPYLRLLHHAQKTCAAFADACLLGRVWLQQRGFGSSLARGGFGGFEWAALVALLLQTGPSKKRASLSSSSSKKKAGATVLSPSLSSTQIFKAVVQFLAATDFRAKPCVLGAPPLAGADLEALRDGDGAPVLYDAGAARQLNLAYKMSAWSAGLLRQHARWTHELLQQDEAAADPFTPTFIARADLALEAFDLVLRIRRRGAAAAAAAAHSRRGAVWDFGHRVFQVLKRALGNRATLLHVQLPPSAAWPVVDRPPSEDAESAGDADADAAHIVVGIAFDPANMARHIDHGPPAEDKKAARAFRAFWGERAELRRFQDGSILETVVWTAGPSAEGLCEEIARYILGARLGLAGPDAIEVVGSGSGSGGFASLVPLAPAADAAAFARAREAFAALERDIRALEDLPLHVRQVAPVDAALRGATIRAPAAVGASDEAALRPMEVVLAFEASGKWPDSLAAIQRAKVAFLLRIGESLEAASGGSGGSGGGGRVTTHLGLENDDAVAAAGDVANRAFLDVVYRAAAPAAFRVRIHSDAEEALLARQARDKTRGPHARAAAAALLATQRRLGAVLPLHTQTMATCCTRFPALSPTLRLVKHWFSAHKLAAHVADELVELLVLHVFLRPHPWQPPASAAPGLLRTLQFLARWDWRTEPLVVDTSVLSNDLPAAADAESGGAAAADAADAAATADPRTRLEAWRKIDPAMNHTVLFVSATHETSGTAFTTTTSTTAAAGTRPLPSKVVAARMTRLARAACRLVKDTDVSLSLSLAATAAPALPPPPADLDPAQLFRPALADYDVLLHLAPRVVRRLVRGDVDDADSSGHHRSVYKNLDPRTGRALHPLPAHPVQLLLDQLNRVYGGGGGGGGVGPIVFFGSAPDDLDRSSKTGKAGSKAGDQHSHVIGALWNPQVHPRTFRVNLPCSFRPVAIAAADGQAAKKRRGSEAAADGEPLIEVNREAILAEIAAIGGSLIERIEVLRKV